jgi:CheY-like chemotaxis protein
VIKTAALRASELAGQLLGFARKGKLINTSVDMHRVVGETVALLGRTVDRRITISLKLEAENPLVNGDPGQLEQVVMNLAVNARDAMPEGGKLELRTASVDLDEAYCRAHAGVDPGSYLLLSVSDTGAGMSEEVRGRIFEPFFTTKPEGEGTGMGLAMAYGIIRNHGGSVGVYSEVGNGTTFKLYLPLAAGAAPVRDRDSRTFAIPGTGTILVVDDEEGVRRVVKSILESLGYTVLLAENGMEAIHLYQDHGADIDLLVLDLTMPVMDGKACFARIRELDPAARVIVATGHAVNEAAQELLDRGARGFVQKPFVKSELAQAVAGALSDDEEPGDA